MRSQSNRIAFMVFAGFLLVLLGVWLLLERFLGPLLYPVAVVLGFLARVGWPLVLIAVGLLFILGARINGWSVSGTRPARSRSDRLLGGVLGGMAVYLRVNATILRVVYALLTLFTGIWLGVLLYLVAMIVLPEEQSGVPYASPQAWGNAQSPPPAPPIPVAPGSASTPPSPPPVPQSPAPETHDRSTQPHQAPPVPPAPANS
jgi:phage shock protein PspC (stress-responsive transcriptional regulator)